MTTEPKDQEKQNGIWPIRNDNISKGFPSWRIAAPDEHDAQIEVQIHKV